MKRWCEWAHGAVAATALAGLFAVPAARAQSSLPPLLEKVGFDPQLNALVPLDLPFRDGTGRTVALRNYVAGGKPMIFALVYYQCPMLCTQVEQGVASMLKVVKFDAGKEFSVVFVSINPSETPAMAAAKKENAVAYYHRPGAAGGWHFLTGDEPAIAAFARAVGFRYAYDPKSKLYAHASGILILTPQGRISRYFYGIEYSPRDVRLALVEASANRIGTPADHLLLFCFQYDPSTGRYSASILRVVRLGGILTVLCLGIFVSVYFRRDARANRKANTG